MEPGIPDQNSKAFKLGIYNLDPPVRFWATPPVHGCLRKYVIHPAAFTYKLPENVSYEEGIAVYLASEASSYVTGGVFTIDGGYTIW